MPKIQNRVGEKKSKFMKSTRTQTMCSPPRRLRRLAGMAACVALSSIATNAVGQTNIAQYKFAATTGTYTALSSPTVLGTATESAITAAGLDDVNYRVSFPTGFTFNYGGVAQTAINVQTNGYAGFSSAIWTSTPYTPLSSTPTGGTFGGMLSPMGRDLMGHYTPGTAVGELSWNVTGSGTDEVLTIQWKDFRHYTSPYQTPAQSLLNFQIKLYKSTHTSKANVIEFVYGNIVNTGFTGTGPQVGVSGNSTTWLGNVNNLMLGNNPAGTGCNWLDVVTGNANSSTVLTSSTYPSINTPNGLTYTFTPPSVAIAPVRTFRAVTAVNTTSAVTTWNTASGATAYRVQYRPVSTTVCNWTALPGTVTDTFATITGLTAATQYQYRVQATDGTNNTIWSHIPDSVGTGNGYTGRSFTTSLYASDLQAQQLQTPAASTVSCYSTVPVTIRIRNAGTTAIDLAATDVVVAATVTSPSSVETTFSVDTLTGTLAAGATRDVIVSTAYNMGATGTYSFDAGVSMTGDLNAANDEIATVTRTNAAPSAVPQLVGFAGYSGTDASLNTSAPGWREGSGSFGGTVTYPTDGTFSSFASPQTTAWGNGARMRFSGTNNGWIISPKVTIPSGGGYTFNFKAFMSGDGTTAASNFVAANNDTFKALVSTDCGVTWTVLNQYHSGSDGGLNSTATGFVNFSIPLTVYDGQDIQVALYARRATTGTATVPNIIVKDIEITSCGAPSGLAVSGTTATTTNATWTAPSGSPTGYEYKVVKATVGVDTGFAYASGTPATNSASISGLDAYVNDYDLYVRTSCGATNSGWAGPLNFKTVCSAPSIAPTALVLNPTSTSVSGSFTKSTGGVANGYLVVRSGPTATPAPVNGASYAAGTTVPGGGNSLYTGTDSNFTHTGATSNTQYKYTVFPYNNTPCTGGPTYGTAVTLSGTAITCPGAPTDQYADASTTSGFSVNWTDVGPGASPLTYDVQIAKNATFTLDTLSFYGVTAPHPVTGLTDFTKYWFRVRASNGCAGTWTANAADTIRTLPLGCTTPLAQPTTLALTANAAGTAIAGTFAGNVATNYLVVSATPGTVPATPVDGTNYTVGSADLGAGTSIVKVDTAHTFNNTGLTPNTALDYYVYSFNHFGCDGGPKYYTTAPLMGKDTTCTGPMAGVTVTDVTYNSMNINWTSLLGGGASPVTYTLEVTTDAAYATPITGSPFTITDPTITRAVTGLSPETDYYYRIKASNTACENIWTTGMQRTKCDPPAIVTTTDASRCGTGTVTLNATADEAGATMRWYAAATGGSSLATGASFVTPSISDTTTYYVGVSGGLGTVSVGNEYVTPPFTTSSTDAGVVFTTTADAVPVYGAQILVSGSGNMTFALQNSTGTAIATSTVTVTGATDAALTTVSFPATFVTGTAAAGYRLLCTSKDASLTWYYPTVSYPKSTPDGEVTLTSGWGWGIAESSVARCVHKLNVGIACTNPTRTPVIANVAEATPINAGTDATICAGGSTPLEATSASSTYTYTWSPATGLSGTTGASVTANPTATTSYILSASDPSGCTAVDTVKVTVNPLPAAPTGINPADTTICEGNSVMLRANPAVLNESDTVGFGSATNYQAPLNRNYNYSASELIYLNRELGFSGKIASIGINKVSGTDTAAVSNVSIYMKTTTDTVVTTTASTTGYTLVYNGSVPNNATSGWMNVNLTTPYDYSGTGNLAVLVVKGNQAWISNYPVWQATSTGSTTDMYKASYYYDDDFSWTSGEADAMARTYNRPNMRFGWSDKESVQWSSVVDLYKDAALTTAMGTTDTNTVVYAAPTTNTTYTVSSVDNGCLSATSVSATVNVTNLGATLGANTSPTTCGGNEGTITVGGLTTGATFSATYTTGGSPVTVPGLTADASGDIVITGLSAGSYTDLSITQTGGCSVDLAGTIILANPASPVIVSTSTSPASCGIENGKIIMNTTGVPALSTHWVKYKVGGAFVTDTVFSDTEGIVELQDLAAGTYDSVSIQNNATLCVSNFFGPLTITTTGLSGDIAPSTDDMNYDQGAGSTVSYTNGSCELISTIQAINGNLGTVNSKVTVAAPATSSTEQPYLGRYYEFTATNNIGARVTIYLNQSDIDAYNALPEIGTQYPAIGAALEDLQFTVFHSTPGSGTGPLGYDDDPANKEVITFADMTIVAPTVSADYWSITFDIDSFSLVVPHSNVDDAPLPIKMENISAVNVGASNRVDWNTLAEHDGDMFEIERSQNGQQFTKIDEMKANGFASRYNFLDNQPFNGINYYRLKLVNNDGSRAYSKIVHATVATTGFQVDAYPNPVSHNLNVKVKGAINGKGTVTLTDATGRLISTQDVDANGMVTINMQHLAQGLYMVKYQDDVNTQTIKVDKNQ